MTTAPPAPTLIRLSQRRGKWVLAAAVLGSGMAMLDATVVNVALPALGRDFGATLSGLQWTVNGYTLTLASLILLGGSLGDRYGRRRIFCLGVTWFAAASLLCGLAPNLPTLVAARMLQGVGGALLTPGSLAIMQASFVPEDRARAVGAWSGLGGIAAAIGPFLGGWLLQATWRLVFLINIPVAVLVLVVAFRHLPETRDPDARGRFDVPGALLGAVGLAGLTGALVRAGDVGWTAATLGTGAIGLLGLVAFGVRERHAAQPMLPFSLFASRQFTAANVVTFAMYGALGGVLFLLVVYLQVVVGFAPIVAGTALLPITVVMLLLSARSGALATRIGPRLQMSVGPVICAGGVALMSRIGRGSSYPLEVLPAVLLFGLGLATTVAPLTATVLGAATERRAGIASGVNNAVARAAGLLAVATLPLTAGLAGTDYRDRATFTAGFRAAMLQCAALLVAAGLLAAATIRNRVAPPVHSDRQHCCPLDGPPVERVGGRMPDAAAGVRG
jgi:EmrB/QacA subfamily drug resistance transporter